MKLRILLCLVTFFGLAIAHAGGLKEGRITSVQVAVSIPDKAFIKVEGSYLTAEPSCSVEGTQFDYVLDISTGTGKALYSMALAAQASGTLVTLEGFGTCTLRAGYEDLNYIHANT